MKKKIVSALLLVISALTMIFSVGLIYAKYAAEVRGEPFDIVVEWRAYQSAKITSLNNYEGSAYTISPDGTLTINDVFYDEETNTWYKVDTLPQGIFQNNTKIKNVVLSDTLTNIEKNAFKGCTSLETVDFGEGLTTIGTEAFSGCTALKNVDMPDTVTTLGTSVFYNCKALETVHISTSLTAIPKQTFFYCASLQSAPLHEGITIVGTAAYKGCESLQEIELPDSVTTLEAEAFLQCSSVTSMEIPNRYIECGITVFKACGFTTITIPGNFVLTTQMFDQCPDLKEVILEEGIEILPSAVFRNCQNLEIVQMPSTLKTIESQALGGSTTKIFPLTIPEGVENISSEAFRSSSGGLRIIYYDGNAVGGEWGGSIPKILVVNSKQLGGRVTYITGNWGGDMVFSLPEGVSAEQLLLRVGRNEEVTTDGVTENQFVQKDEEIVYVTDGQFSVPKDFATYGDIVVVSIFE